ncbi:hypothetical protein CRENBAI_009806 [Crenichthys baileyi]|uniref:Secreted protein n=1 Tax=Crenichthys baileyi TaxID=28760 RepID=A0AAV9SE69_9TELE
MVVWLGWLGSVACVFPCDPLALELLLLCFADDLPLCCASATRLVLQRLHSSNISPPSSLVPHPHPHSLARARSLCGHRIRFVQIIRRARQLICFSTFSQAQRRKTGPFISLTLCLVL